MSKLWKGVKKVFSKIGKFVKKYWKYIAIAVAIYFTAGIALSAMPATASFAASMPGFGVGGMFSNAAVSLGFQGAAGSGIAGTVAANAAAASATAAGTAAATSAGSAAAGGAGAGSAVSGGFVMPGSVAEAAAAHAAAGATAGAGITAGGAAAANTAAAAGAAGAAGGATTATVAGMSGLEKVALASTVFKGAGALLSDSENDILRKKHNREYAQSYGIGRDGQGPGFTGLVKDTFGDMYGGTKGTAGQQGQQNQQGAPATPFDESGQSNDVGATPFDDNNQLASQNAPKQAYINKGYRAKDYRPI